MSSKNKPVMFRPSDRVRSQLRELVDGGYCTNQNSALSEALQALYYHKVESANEITLASRKVAESAVDQRPEIIQRDDGSVWLNLGSGLLPEVTAQMFTAQFADAVAEENAIGEWLIYEPVAAMDAYNAFKIIVMFRMHG